MGIGPVEAHDFALLVHYVTLRQAHGELDEAGLTLEAAFDAERGAPVGLDEDLSGIRYFHIVARSAESLSGDSRSPLAGRLPHGSSRRREGPQLGHGPCLHQSDEKITRQG